MYGALLNEFTPRSKTTIIPRLQRSGCGVRSVEIVTVTVFEDIATNILLAGFRHRNTHIDQVSKIGQSGPGSSQRSVYKVSPWASKISISVLRQGMQRMRSNISSKGGNNSCVVCRDLRYPRPITTAAASGWSLHPQSNATDLQIIQTGNVDFEHIVYNASPKPPQPVYPDILAPPCGFGAKTYEVFCEKLWDKMKNEK